jgi:hypothetical protein
MFLIQFVGDVVHRTLILFIIIISFFKFSFGQGKSGGYIHGLIVGDYFYKTGGDAQPYGGATQFSQPLPKDSSSFQIRRLHIFYDYTFSNEFSTRFQLEGNEKSLDPNGRLSLYMKSAYLEWKNLVPMSSLYIGLVPTPTWINVESQWGYRSVEKTITDFRGLGSLTDMGVHLRGTLFSEGSVGYSLMVGNGDAQMPENNKYKKFYAALNGSPIKNFYIETYVDYEPAVQDKDRTTWKAFLSYQKPSLMIGAEILEQLQKKQDTLFTDHAPFGISLFSWYRLSDYWKVYGRIDYYDADRLSSHTGFYEYFISVGFDYTPIKNIHFMPNIWINTFLNKSTVGKTKNADVVPRITFFFLFN